MEIKVTFEIGERAAELIARYFPVNESVKQQPAGISGMDEAGQRAAIVAEVIELAKAGKSGIVKDILNGFDASRVSELAPEDYTDFYNALKEL